MTKRKNMRYGGVLLVCKKTQKFLLLKRNEVSSYPLTWSIVSGGIEKGEDYLDGVKRELWEETKIESDEVDFELFEVDNSLVPKFHFYIGYCSKEIEVQLCDENIDYGWFDMNNLPKPLFPTLYSSLVRIF